MDEISLLKDEYLKLIDVVAGYDNNLMVIKGWSITVGLALLGYAITAKRRSLLIACIIGLIAFAFVDAKYKEYQVTYYPRMAEIEQCIAAKQKASTTNCVVFSIDKSWWESKKWYGVFFQFFNLGVLMPHILVLLLAAYLYRNQDIFGKEPKT